MAGDTTVSEWTKLQRNLLDLERESEKLQLSEKIESLSAKDCEAAGLSLLSLSIQSVTAALFGRNCISLARSDSKELLKSFKVGDEVVMYCPKLRNTPEFVMINCIVSKLLPASIELICDEVDESIMDRSIRVDARANDSTHNKYLSVLNDLEGSVLPLRNILFGDKDFQSMSLGLDFNGKKNSGLSQRARDQPVEFINENLNESQKRAVLGALEIKLISVIHGPPGTGKTSTVVEIIQQSAIEHRRVLVCAPSNVAVDNILERLIVANDRIGTQLGKGKTGGNKLAFVRLGHPARVSQRGAYYCLDALIARDDGTDIVSDVRAEIEGLKKEILKCNKKERSRRRDIQGEVRTLCKEVRKREDKVVKGIMRSANVVLCTCVTAGSRLLKDVDFDLVIIDEAAQALEVSCWIPIMRANACVLVGDHNQLPPTVKSAAAVSKGLAVTLFERVIENELFRTAGLIHMLDTQYRMNDLICKCASLR